MITRRMTFIVRRLATTEVGKGPIIMMNKPRRPIILLQLIAIAICSGAALANNDLTLSVPLASQSVDVNDNVTVTLNVANLLQAINGVQVFVQFDPLMLEFISITPNAAAGDLASGWVVGQELVSGGDITYLVALIADSTMTNGLVATITFKALAVGSTQVIFDPFPAIPTKLTGVDNATIIPDTLTDSESIVINAVAAAVTLSAIDTFYAGKFSDALDTSGSCLSVGTTAVGQNITNYINGITGFRMQFTNLVDFATTPADAFSFEWTTGSGTSFTPISVAAGTISVSAVDGGGVTTVDIVFDDNLIRRRWLKVTVDATQISTSGVLLDGELQGNPLLLPSGDGTSGGDAVFFFGSMPGDVDGDRVTLFSDAVQTRVQLNPFVSVPIDNVYDVNKDGLVLFSDAVQVRVELNPFFTLPLISP